MTINETIDQIIKEFEQFDDWMDKYNYLIEMGRSVPLIEDTEKTDSNLIVGCQSRVWLSSEYKDLRNISHQRAAMVCFRW